MDLDSKIITLLQKIPGVAIDGFLDYAVEGGHFLIHATIAFILLSLPISHWWAFISLGLALLKEFVLDGEQEPRRLKSNLIFRCSGSVFPFVTLFWRGRGS